MLPVISQLYKLHRLAGFTIFMMLREIDFHEKRLVSDRGTHIDNSICIFSNDVVRSDETKCIIAIMPQATLIFKSSALHVTGIPQVSNGGNGESQDCWQMTAR
jgi:hypothetical protein